MKQPRRSQSRLQVRSHSPKRRRREWLAVVMAVAVVVVLVSSSARARRAPAPGGSVGLSLPTELMSAVIEAHLYAPLLVPRDRGEESAPTVDGLTEAWGSHIITRVESSEGGRRWRFLADAPPPDLAASMMRCLRGQSERHFAENALRAAGITADITADARGVTVALSRPVSVLPELFGWCPLRPVTNAPTGPYALSAPGRLAWRSGSYDAPPLLGAIELRAHTGSIVPGAEKADVIINPNQADGLGGATLLSPWPDVIVLVQSPTTRESDPFDLKEGTSLRASLRADLLAAVWANGRGGPTDALLPPGVAPARPLPEALVSPPTPLSLSPVDDDAPRLPLTIHDEDPLTDAVVERLAVILRNKRLILEPRRQSLATDGAELVRWRPPTRDAALALLSFVGEREQLLLDDDIRKALADERLLGADVAERLAAALVLERALLDSHLVVPLLVVERVIGVDPDLRGIVVRGDGVPLLDGAWWGGGR